MRVLLARGVGFLLLAPAVSAEESPASPAVCSGKSAADCGVSKEDFKQAQAAFKRGIKLRKQDPERAFEELGEAARLVPRNAAYVTTRELLKQQLVFEHMQRGKELMLSQRTLAAAAEFRRALELDPGNQFATERLRSTVNPPLPPGPTFIEPAPEDGEIAVHPKPGRQSLHFSGDTRAAFTTVGNAFGVKMTFDASVQSRPLRLDVGKATFAEAMDALTAVSRTFWMPVSSNEALIAADTPATHKELDRWVLRTFYLPETTTPQDLNEVINMFRVLFEVRFVTQQPASHTITVRGPAAVIEAASRFLETLWAGRPQVMLDVEMFEINRQMLTNIGLNMPLQFNIFNIPQTALAALGNQNAQQLINQLIATGGINQANTTAISALLAQLQSQQFSLFSQPVATFGGGSTLMGVAVPPASFNFSKNESRVYTLEKLSMRASQGNAATFRLGTRYPILNGTFSPVFNTPQIANIIGTQSFVAPFPSFTYEDLGVTVKAKPLIHGGSDVTLDLELEIKALTGQAFNGVPVISNRNYKGVITVADGEPAVIAGSISMSESATLQGLPGFSKVPGLNYALSNHTNQIDTGELLIVLTPHIVTAAPTGGTPAIVVPSQ